MQRRFVYALTGGLLSVGAPAGLLGIRLARRRSDGLSLARVASEVAADRAAYGYVSTSTALVFALFGYLLGCQADKLAEQSETDSLTGLSNARGLAGRLRSELARSIRYREPVALLLVDLDGLKSINDRYGHRAGDVAIRAAADVIRAELRESDLGARWGGDEFAIVAPNTARAAALMLARRIRAFIPKESVPWHLTASVGVATMDPKTGGPLYDSSTLMRNADVALYEAKKRGKNRVAIKRPDGDFAVSA